MTQNKYSIPISEIHKSFKSVIQKKAHGGKLKVEKKEGEGSTFIIQLLVV